MASHAAFFTRVLADFFPGKSATSSPAQSPAPASPASAVTPTSTSRTSGADAPDRVVGQGASDETIITIADVPNLFVAEATCVVQFRPAFDELPSQTQFGLKILPELAPHWSQVHVHRCSLKDAIATAIRSGGLPPVEAPAAVEVTVEKSRTPRPSRIESRGPQSEPPQTPRRENVRDSGAVEGRVLSWGEEKFPDRKAVGKSRFYTSFAMHIDTVAGERTLQGEGLKEAIAEAGCVVGDFVSVRRLRKIKVPAIRPDGSQKIVNGEQVFWDKWLWSISK